eukprot:761095-Hanusia_phi.AAC.4
MATCLSGSEKFTGLKKLRSIANFSNTTSCLTTTSIEWKGVSTSLTLAGSKTSSSPQAIVQFGNSNGALPTAIAAGAAGIPCFCLWSGSEYLGGKGPAVLTNPAVKAYVLHLVKFAVYQAVKTGLMLELRHPRWRRSIEDATSSAVDAAIKSQALKGIARLRLAEKAAVEGATKARAFRSAGCSGMTLKQATKELEFEAMKGGREKKEDEEIAQRIEDAAVSAAIQSASEATEKYKPLVFASSAQAMQRPVPPLQLPQRFSLGASLPVGQTMIRAAPPPSAYAVYPVRYVGPAGQVEVEEPEAAEGPGMQPQSFQVD